MGSLRRSLISLHRALKSSNSISPIETLLRPQYGYGLAQRSYSTNTTSNLDIDLSNQESKRRLYNRLIYRSKQRGFLELDLVLGKWVEEHIHSMDEHGIKALVDVLDLENPDLWKWLSGQEQPPEALETNPVFTAVRNKVSNNLNSTIRRTQEKNINNGLCNCTQVPVFLLPPPPPCDALQFPIDEEGLGRIIL